MFTIGDKMDPSVEINCTKQPLPKPSGAGSAGAAIISVSYARSPAGRWSQPRAVFTNSNRPGVGKGDWNCLVSNPSPLLLDNGTVGLIFSSLPCTGPNYGKYGTSLGLALASHWNATNYTQSPAPIWLKQGAAWPDPHGDSNGVGNCEDPFVWQDARKNFHIISHSQGQRNLCGGGESAGNACAIHFFSRDLLGPWLHSMTAVYSGAVNVTSPNRNGAIGGSREAVMVSRQRPQIVFGADASPLYLFNAGNFDQADHTFAFEFNNEI